MPVPNEGQDAHALAAHNSTILYFDWFVNASGSLDPEDEDIVLANFVFANATTHPGYNQTTIPLGSWESDGGGILSLPTNLDPTLLATANWTTPITGGVYHDNTAVWGWDYLRNPVTGGVLSGGELLQAGETIRANI